MAVEALKASAQTHTSEFVLAKLAKESSIRGAISESCAEWVKSGRVPLMSQGEALFFYDRIFYGCALGGLLSQGGFSWAAGEPELLIWLLIDSWERISCLTWKWQLENPE
jgi:hypothetical protein